MPYLCHRHTGISNKQKLNKHTNQLLTENKDASVFYYITRELLQQLIMCLELQNLTRLKLTEHCNLRLD